MIDWKPVETSHARMTPNSFQYHTGTQGLKSQHQQDDYTSLLLEHLPLPGHPPGLAVLEPLEAAGCLPAAS